MLISDSKYLEGFIKFDCLDVFQEYLLKNFNMVYGERLKKRGGTCFISEMTGLRDKLTITFEVTVDTK